MPKKNNMAMMLQALKNAGLSDNQARILAAEIGRENSFEDRYLWGYHLDPKNNAKNIGIISWQGSRATGVERELRNAGLLKNGKIVKGQASLDVMAKYLVNEIRTTPTYAQTKRQFLDNPNVDYHTGTKVLGTNFIRWRYNDPKYKSGHRNRDNFYKQLGGVVPSGGPSSMGAESTSGTSEPTQATTPQITTPQITQRQAPKIEDIFGMNTQANGVGSTVLRGGAGLVQATTPFEQSMFSSILSSGVDASREPALVSASQAVAAAYEKVQNQNLMNHGNSLTDFVAQIFNSV